MWIVVTILKWIGILLGGILGLLLFFGVLVLFVPVRYRIRGRSRDKMEYSFRVSWCLFLVAVRKKIKSEKIVLTVFGIPIKCLAGEKKNPEKETGEKKGKEKRKGQTKRKATSEEKDEEPETKKKKAFSFKKVSSIIGLVKDTGNRRAAGKVFQEFRMLVRYLTPQKMRGTAIVGTGDPCTTGLLFGGISLFPVVYEKGVYITPDFEEKRFEAEGSMAGRLRVIYFVKLVFRLYRDNELKQLWKQVKP